MEPPSDELRLGLESLQLAGERELTRCRPGVRALTRGLPVYDTVWIDVLVRNGVLTPFQGRYFDRRQPEQLQIAPGVILQDQVHFDRVMPIFRVWNQHKQTSELAAILALDSPLSQDMRRRLAEFSHGTIANVESASQVSSAQTGSVPRQLVILQNFVTGVSLDQLLVRRGRFPEDVVAAIGGGICQALESQLHGDVRLANVWITPTGQVQLINGGILTALFPSLGIHLQLPADFFHTAAPEQFEPSRSVTVQSELYSLGSVMWQLLAGRTPFSLVDPLDVVAAHRKQSIPDIRTLSPETSPELAELIASLTQRNPARRPNDLPTVREQLSNQMRVSQQRLRQFLDSFETASPRNLDAMPPPRKNLNAAVALVTLVLLCVSAGLFTLHQQNLFRSEVQADQEIQAGGVATVENTREVALVPLATKEELGVDLALTATDEQPQLPTTLGEASPPRQPGPFPDERPSVETATLFDLPSSGEAGQIDLSRPGQYRLESLTVDGTLTIRGQHGPRSTVLLLAGNAALNADRIVLEGVTLRFLNRSQLHIDAHQLHFRNCRINEPRDARIERNNGSNARIRWTSSESGSVESGQLLVHHCVIQTQDTLFDVQLPLSTGLLENVIQLGDGPLICLQSGVRSGMQVPLVLNRCSITGGGSALTIKNLSDWTGAGQLSLQGENSVFATQSNVPLIRIDGTQESTLLHKHLEIFPQGWIVRPHTMLVGMVMGKEVIDVSKHVSVEGVLTAQFAFAPPAAFDENGLQIPQLQIENLPLRTSSTAPGFSADLLH